MTLLGIMCVGIGILMLVARDFFWALTEMGNSFAGRQSERTELCYLFDSACMSAR